MSNDDQKVGHVISVKGSKISGILIGKGAESGAAPDTVQFGGLVKMKTRVSSVFGMVGGMWIADPSVAPEAARKMLDIDMLGEMVHAEVSGSEPRFQRGVSVYPPLGADILAVTPEDLAMIYAPPLTSNVRVGTIHQDRGLAGFIATDSLLGKHFAVLGTTGSGKSCSTALILRAILDQHPNGHVVLLDPHNEYGSAFGEKAELINLSNLDLPYWLMNFEEAVAAFVTSDGKDRETETAILKDAILEARRKFCGAEADTDHITVDTPVPYRLGEVQRIIGNAMGRLDKTETSLPYLRLQTRIQALSSDRRFAFMFSGVVVRDTMMSILSRILRVPVSGRPATIIDLSGVPSDIVDVVVSVLCRMIFDFAVWSVDAKAVPVLLVCEEAHRYVPSDENLGFAPTRRSISRIAKEGRKYGVSLCLVSQRPSELSSTILSQCNTVFALRMCNEHDQEFVRTTLPDGAGGLLAALPALHAGEAIAVGEGVTVPMRLCFDTLEESCRPKSGTASFSEAWETDHIDDWFIEDTIKRWRHQRRDDTDAAEAA
jgi:DNA helicase HerA-like ATPase